MPSMQKMQEIIKMSKMPRMLKMQRMHVMLEMQPMPRSMGPITKCFPITMAYGWESMGIESFLFLMPLKLVEVATKPLQKKVILSCLTMRFWSDVLFIDMLVVLMHVATGLCKSTCQLFDFNSIPVSKQIRSLDDSLPFPIHGTWTNAYFKHACTREHNTLKIHLVRFVCQTGPKNAKND